MFPRLITRVHIILHPYILLWRMPDLHESSICKFIKGFINFKCLEIILLKIILYVGLCICKNQVQPIKEYAEHATKVYFAELAEMWNMKK